MMFWLHHQQSWLLHPKKPTPSFLVIFLSLACLTQVRGFVGESTGPTSAFGVVPRALPRGNLPPPPSYVVYSVVRRFAIIYGENGEIMDDEIATESPPAAVEQESVLRDSLAAQLDPAMLTRIACAFAPPPHTSLHPKDVQSVTLVSVDPSKKLEVALAIPQDNGVMDSGVCVQILVPIVFPMSCVNLDGTIPELSVVEQRILQALNQMDAQAKERIVSREVQLEQYEQAAAQASILRQLEEEPYAVALPDWWTFPELKVTLANECDKLKALLNEADFSRDLRVLCQVYGKTDKPVSKLLQARVASVGPSGLYLRAYASLVVDPTNNDDVDVERFTTLEVPIAFPKTTTTADDLRDSVLDLVESVENVPEQEIVSAAPPVVVAVAPSVESASVAEPKPVVEATPADAKVVEAPVAVVAVEAPTKESIILQAARQQPKSPDEEARLAAKYAAIVDVGERAYTILRDLGMI